jgi:ABC-type branched-subunit amino acid transport system permease subunit
VTEYVFTLHWPITFEVPVVAVVLGLVVGLSYALLAIGLILIYRSTRVINLAHGEIGAFAAAIVAILVNENGWPYWVAALVALVVAGVLGAAVELLVIRRLFRAPRLIVLVATMGLAQLFLVGTYFLNGRIDNRLVGFPAPFSTTLTLGSLVLQPGELTLLVAVPIVAAALAAFFRLTGFGVAVRAAAENADSARLVGIPTKRISTFVWMTAGLLSAGTALMLAPGRGLTVTESLGPDLLMRALAAAVLARLTSLPRAVVAGIVIGVIEKVVAWNYSVGEVELVLFVVVMGALLFQHRGSVRDTEASAWQLASLVRPIPRAVQHLPAIRAMNWIGLAAFVAVAAAVPFALSNSQIFLLTSVVAFAIAGLSVTILTGYSGQISLGQVAFFGIGAAANYQLTVELYVPFWVALLLSGLIGAGVAVLIGIPALRIRGLFLAVTTLAFALVTQKWLLGQTWLAGPGVIAPRPYWGSLDFASQHAYYYLALSGLLLAILICRNTLRSGVGRNLMAIRDNEAQGAAFTVPVVRTKLTAFAISGFLAAFGGAIYGHGVETFQVANFPVSDSLRVVSMTIIGGLGSIPGTIMGAFFVVGIDRLVEVQYLRLLSTSIGLLLLLLYLPGGFGQILYAVRDRLVASIARRAGVDVNPDDEPGGPDQPEDSPLPVAARPVDETVVDRVPVTA